MRDNIIAIEGIDGSGKGTQAEMLRRYFEDKGIPVSLISFPRYSDTFFGKEIANYLNGDFGTIEQVPPKLAAVLYAGDRFESKKLICKELQLGKVIILDRYVSSNVAHHAAKLRGFEKNTFAEWVYTLEYEVFGMPKAKVEILLDIPYLISKKMVQQKEKRDYTNNKHDMHEQNEEYLKRVANLFSEIAQLNNWVKIECYANTGLKTKNQVFNEIINNSAIIDIVRGCKL